MKERFNFTVEKELLESVSDCAKRDHVSKSKWIENAIRDAIEQIEEEEIDKLAREGYRFYAEENLEMAELGMQEYADIVLKDPFEGIEKLRSHE